eukprot:gb/GECG01005159.1/.p1 GENE.gb/GECG01005159.1/~~gb/GECG01005159.1/.p1  ORF type:complete len:683 (+),score=135.94 gb/GECG01005159.1/:1-2049(+)
MNAPRDHNTTASDDLNSTPFSRIRSPPQEQVYTGDGGSYSPIFSPHDASSERSTLQDLNGSKQAWEMDSDIFPQWGATAAPASSVSSPQYTSHSTSSHADKGDQDQSVSYSRTSWGWGNKEQSNTQHNTSGNGSGIQNISFDFDYEPDKRRQQGSDGEKIVQPDRYLPSSISSLSRDELVSRLRSCQEALNDRELQLLEEQTRSMQELENLRSILHERERTIQTQSKELKTLREGMESSHVHNENKTLKKRVKHAEKKLELTRQRLEDSEKNFNGVVNQLKGDRDQLMQERDELWRTKQDHASTIQSLRECLQQKEQECRQIIQERDNVYAEKHKLQELLAETKKVLRRVRDREDANAAALRGQNGTIAQLRRQFEEAEKEQEELQRNVESLESELNEKKSQLQQYKARLYDLQCEFDRKNESFEKSQQTEEELQETRKKLDETESVLSELRQEYRQQKHQDEQAIKQLRDTLVDKNQVIDALRNGDEMKVFDDMSESQRDELRIECERLSKELHQQKQLTEQARQEARDYMDRANEARKKLDKGVSHTAPSNSERGQYVSLLVLIGMRVLPAVERLCRLVESAYSRHNFAIDELLQLQEDEVSDIKENGEVAIPAKVDTDAENHFLSFVEAQDSRDFAEPQLDVDTFVSQMKRLTERINTLRYKLADQLAGTSAEDQCRMQ